MNKLFCYPKTAARIRLTPVLFTWESIPSSQRYHFQLVESEFDKANQLHVDSILNTTSLSLPLHRLGTYEWRVRAENELEVTAFSKGKFSTRNPFAGRSVRLVSPSRGIELKKTFSISLGYFTPCA